MSSNLLRCGSLRLRCAAVAKAVVPDNGYPEGASREIQGDLVLTSRPTGSQPGADSFEDRWGRKAGVGCDGRFDVSADHIGQLAEYIAHVVVDCVWRIHGEKLACKLASLLPIALDGHRAVPITAQVDRRREAVFRWTPFHVNGADFEIHHRCKDGFHDLDRYIRA